MHVPERISSAGFLRIAGFLFAAAGAAAAQNAEGPAGDPAGESAVNGTSGLLHVRPEALSAADPFPEYGPEFDRAMEDALRQVFPMDPDMIRRYRKAFEQTETAIRETPEPAPMITTDLVSLDPGAQPPLLVTAPGVASVIAVIDIAGNPWPVTGFIAGDAALVQVTSLGPGSNALAVSPLARLGTTNLVLTLQGADTPVSLRIRIDRTQAHFRHDIQIALPGPNTDLTVTHVPDIPRAGDGLLLAALTGTGMPDGARALAVEGVDASVTEYGGHLYVRSGHNLLSPSWTGSMAGAGGIRVYRIEPAASLLFSVNGRVTRARVTGADLFAGE